MILDSHHLGKLAPKSKADFAFLLHGYYHLKQDNGVMAIVLPHGVLFRGNAEGTIRKALLEEGAIDTVIGLPANIFFNTSIPTTVIISQKGNLHQSLMFYFYLMPLRSLIRGKIRTS